MFSNRSKRLQLVINLTFINLICRSGCRSWVIKKSTPTNCFHITTAAWTGASIQDEQISFKTKTIRSCYSSLPHRDTGKINTFKRLLVAFRRQNIYSRSKYGFKTVEWNGKDRKKWKKMANLKHHWIIQIQVKTFKGKRQQMKFRQNQKTSKLKIQINLCPRSPLQ